jgi:hypothetical protein
MKQIITQEARRAVMIGRKNHYRFQVIEKGREWVYEETDSPQVGLDRIKVLKEAEVPIKRYWIGHEAPRLLPAPKAEPKPQPKPAPDRDFKNTPQILPDSNVIADFLIMFFAMFFRILLLDPALIVELEDGSLIEVMRWYD